jgi:hypothetical protein
MEIIRRCRFAPYRKGYGPLFTLTIWDTYRADARGQSYLGYCLRAGGRVLFTGSDFAGSPMHADDSDATVAAVMSFLTLRPGDTDPDYFRGYGPEQLAFCSDHAESLSAAVSDRFGEF